MPTDILQDQGVLFLGSRIKRLADRMQADAALVLEATDLPLQPSFIPLLAALDRYGPLTVTEAVQALGISQPAVTRIFGALADLGFVDASRPSADQRQKTIDLTAEGRALVARIKRRLWPKVRAAAEALCADLSGPFLTQIDALEARLTERSLADRVADNAEVDFTTGLTIRDFSDELAPAFYDLTAEWVESMFTLEDNDRLILANPRGVILDRGGVILFVEAEGLGIVGTGALIKIDEGIFELTKMGVTPRAQGRKAGEFLLRALIDRAVAIGMDDLFLLTNKKCGAAIHLYEKIGFRHDEEIMQTHGRRYARCDVAMRYPLPASKAVAVRSRSERPAPRPGERLMTSIELSDPVRPDRAGTT